MTISNLAALLDDLESGARANADTTENAGELIAPGESALTANELEKLLGVLPLLSKRKRLRLVHFRDNFSGDFRPFRVR